ncbi:MAG: M23 family metallopeptidase [Spirochaetales bacterium]|nr:M23 family metallopeptidase [Spirochaetales bacterium]
MIKRVCAFVLPALLAAVGAAGFDWPVEKLVLTATFAEHRGDHFHSGVDLGGGEQPVYPISEGEVVYVHEEGAGPASLPVGLGNFVVLQHQGGIRSIYAHLKDGSAAGIGKSVNGATPVGVVGESGYSAGKHLHLSVIDTEMGTIINPFLVLPPLPDSQKPAIRDLYVRSDKELVRLGDRAALRRGEFEVLGSVYDIRPDVSFLWKMAPYKIYLYQDGREVTSLVFDSLHERRTEGSPDGSLAPEVVSELTLVGTDQGFGRVYEEEWLYRLGFVTLVPGQSSLVVFAADFAGNESSREFVISVTE